MEAETSEKIGVARLSVADGIGVITIDSPPVNALGARVRRGLDEGFRAFASDPSVAAIVLICGGRTFFAGADITEFGRELQEPDLAAVFDIIEDGSKPVIAAIHGTALGGGLELALVCHHRVAVPSAQVGLPEVKLGLLPGAGGTQRLTRIVGAAVALDLICTGRPIRAAEAHELGILDMIAGEATLREDAIGFARRVLAAGGKPVRVRDRREKVDVDRGRPEIFAEFRRAHEAAFAGFHAPENIIRSIEAAVALPFEEGLRREAQLFAELYGSVQAAAQQHVFFAEREAFKIAGMPKGTTASHVGSVGIIGTGSAASDLASTFARAGMKVTRLEKGFDEDAPTGTAVGASTPYAALSEMDLVIEATRWNRQARQSLFQGLEGVVGVGAILASSSDLDELERIATAALHPERMIGLRFPAPLDSSRLIEVARLGSTSKAAAAAALRLAKRLGKVAVLTGAGPDTIAQRLDAALARQIARVACDGLAPAVIEAALRDFGFPVRVPRSEPDACEATERDDGREKASEWVARPVDLTLIERLLYPVVNEAVRMLEVGHAQRASDIDIAAVLDLGWPIYTGGPMFWADTAGLPKIVAALDGIERHAEGPAPASMLRRLAADGRRLTA